MMVENFLPTPVAIPGKIIPNTVYTTKNFDTRRSTHIVSQWLQMAANKKDDPSAMSDENGDVPYPHNKKLSFNGTEAVHYDKEEEEHLPAGQHLLVDIDNVDASFLNSEVQLATAMIGLVDNSGLTLLSYHCHGLNPEGVSCVGVLLESHVAFHTWPKEGVITLDVFTCGETSLLDSIPSIEQLFAIPQKGKDQVSPTFLWAYKRRGFKDQSAMKGARDTFAYPLGMHGMKIKKEVRYSTLIINNRHFSNY
jgi:S-adenosylmethionine decarboxylase proenzyme